MATPGPLLLRFYDKIRGVPLLDLFFVLYEPPNSRMVFFFFLKFLIILFQNNII